MAWYPKSCSGRPRSTSRRVPEIQCARALFATIAPTDYTVLICLDTNFEPGATQDQSMDERSYELGIAGEAQRDLPGVRAVRAFLAWASGLLCRPRGYLNIEQPAALKTCVLSSKISLNTSHGEYGHDAGCCHDNRLKVSTHVPIVRLNFLARDTCRARAGPNIEVSFSSYGCIE